MALLETLEGRESENEKKYRQNGHCDVLNTLTSLEKTDR